MTNGDITINTSGGASVGRDVQTGGDFVGRDEINFIMPLGSVGKLAKRQWMINNQA